MDRVLLNKLRIKQSLPLEAKIELTKRSIRTCVEYWGEENVYISYSGGKDSIVTTHIVRSMYPDIPLVFCDTGLEFPELRDFATRQENITFIYPSMSFLEVIKRYGYPITTKENAVKLYKLRENNLKPEYRNYLLRGDERGKYGTLPNKYHKLIDADYKIGAGCCAVMKKRPLHYYERVTGKVPITGETTEESRSREQAYLKHGCNAFQRKTGFKCTPIAFWTEQDVLEYIYTNNIPIPSVYGKILWEDGKYYTTGEKRTGCVYCCFGADKKDENGETRFVRLKRTHPKLYSYCINGGRYQEGKWVPHKGLGLAHILNELEIDY